MARRKEKPLTLEQVKAKLIELTTPQWQNSEPLLGLAPHEGQIKLIPLTEFAEQNTLAIFFLDVGDYHFEVILDIIAEWREMYKRLPWRPILIMEQKYIFMKQPKFFDRFKISASFHDVPIYYDAQGDWFQHYQMRPFSHLMIVHQGNVVFKERLWPNPFETIRSAEGQLHDALRIEDPGLPLYEIQLMSSARPVDRKYIKATETIQNGRWGQANDSIASDDSNAYLTIPFEGQRLRMIASSHPQARDITRVSITFNDEPLQQSHFGANVHTGDKGTIVAEVNRTQGIYELINSETVIKGNVKIKLLNALENPILIYEFRTS